MASRVFDTYTPGGDDALPTFLHSLADGRILCFAILVRIEKWINRTMNGWTDRYKYNHLLL